MSQIAPDISCPHPTNIHHGSPEKEDELQNSAYRAGEGLNEEVDVQLYGEHLRQSRP